MNLDIPIKVEIRAQSSSGFTRDTVDSRINALVERAYMEGAKNEELRSELDYLRALKQRKGWE